LAGHLPAGYAEHVRFFIFRYLNLEEFLLIASIALLTLFLACTIYDLRDREVPMPLTVGGLVGTGVYALFNGLWSPVLLTIALTHIADFEPREKRLAFALTLAVFSAIFQPAAALICALILGFWILWEFGILGGADVKLLIAAILVIGSPNVLIPIAVSGGIQGVIASLQKNREIPFVASIFCGTLLFVIYPYF
jgi:Flp pilus assembly protein protease CpaA